MLQEDISKLMVMIPQEDKMQRSEGTDMKIQGGAFDGVLDQATPFMYQGGEGINAGIGEVEWVIAKDRYKYDEAFDRLNPIDGKISGAGTHYFFSVEQFLFAPRPAAEEKGGRMKVNRICL